MNDPRRTEADAFISTLNRELLARVTLLSPYLPPLKMRYLLKVCVCVMRVSERIRVRQRQREETEEESGIVGVRE